jgi:hypothetical protein
LLSAHAMKNQVLPVLKVEELAGSWKELVLNNMPKTRKNNLHFLLKKFWYVSK